MSHKMPCTGQCKQGCTSIACTQAIKRYIENLLGVEYPNRKAERMAVVCQARSMKHTPIYRCLEVDSRFTQLSDIQDFFIILCYDHTAEERCVLALINGSSA